MKPEQQIIAIAEACGWRLKWQNQGGAPLLETKPQGHCWEVWFNPDRRTVDSQGNEVYPPDYLNNLNAMHEAEKVLNAGQINSYLGHLYLFTEVAKFGSNPWEIVAARVAIHATAAQRAEAFLKTLGLWKE
jgi:hypothetical protein